MSPATFRHIGGAVLADHGRVTLSEARTLATFYAREARSQTPAVSDECRRRANALQAAAAAASTWRRAAGWHDPDRADRPPPVD